MLPAVVIPALHAPAAPVTRQHVAFARDADRAHVSALMLVGRTFLRRAQDFILSKKAFPPDQKKHSPKFKKSIPGTSRKAFWRIKKKHAFLTSRKEFPASRKSMLFHVHASHSSISRSIRSRGKSGNNRSNMNSRARADHSRNSPSSISRQLTERISYTIAPSCVTVSSK